MTIEELEKKLAATEVERDGFRTSWEDEVNKNVDIEWNRVQAMIAMGKIQDIVLHYRNIAKQDDNNSRT